MGNMHEWGGGTALLAVILACDGVETPLPPRDEGSGGATSAYLHGSSGASCGGQGSASSGGGASAAGSLGSLPGEFDTGAGGAAPASSGGVSGAISVTPGDPNSGLGGTGGDSPAPRAKAFVISEYVEGSSTYKALELTALEDSTFQGCRVAIYFNGATTANGAALEGELDAGQSHVLCSSALLELIPSCDQSAGLTFNGDDAIVLECDGVVVDAIGQIGVDPGTAWGTGDFSLLDHTLRRSCSAIPDTDPNDAYEPSLDWMSFPKDSFEDLGLRSCSEPVGAGGGGGQGAPG